MPTPSGAVGGHCSSSTDLYRRGDFAGFNACLLGHWCLGAVAQCEARCVRPSASTPREQLVSADADPSKGAGAAVREAVERELSRWGASGTASGFGAGRRRSWEAPNHAVATLTRSFSAFAPLPATASRVGLHKVRAPFSKSPDHAHLSRAPPAQRGRAFAGALPTANGRVRA